MRQEHRAGEKLVRRLPRPARCRSTTAAPARCACEAELFVAVLGAINYLYAEAVPSQGLPHWVSAHVHAFEAIGALPRVVVCDNLRSGVTPSASLRARRQRHLRGDGGPLRRRRHPGPTGQAPGQGQGRSRGPARRALDPGSAAQPALLLAWPRPTPRSRELRGCDQRPPVPEAARARAGSWFEELDRPALRPLPATRYEFARWQVGSRSTSTTTSSSTATTTPCPTSLVGARVDVRITASTVEVFHASRRVASHLRDDTRRPPHHRPRAHARVPPPPRRVDPEPHHRLGGEDRPGHRRPGRGDPGGPAPSRAGLPLLPGHHAPRRPLRPRAAGGRLRPRPGRPRPVAIAPSSRSCATASTPSRCRRRAGAAPIPTTRTCAAPATTDEEEPTCSPTPPSTGCTPCALPGMARGLAEQREHADYAALGFEERLGHARRPRAHRAPQPPPRTRT